MNGRLKPVSDQVIVVVGAGAGLGLEVARKAAKAGAAVVLADADEAAVRAACEAISKAGGRVHPVAADAASEEGCARIGRAAVARFERIDGWIDATGSQASLQNAAQGLVRHMATRGGSGALAAFGRRLPRAAAAELRRSRGAVAATLIALPRGLGLDSPNPAAAGAALHALSHPMGRMTVAGGGRRLSALTEAGRHRGAILGVGLLAAAGAALWFNRGRIGVMAGPRLGRAMRPLAARTALTATKRPPRKVNSVRFLR
jgi:NAD(P)-dependent dehydrogenase (short-subunit alcohol dehydrogenase family)